LGDLVETFIMTALATAVFVAATSIGLGWLVIVAGGVLAVCVVEFCLAWYRFRTRD
jgi:hypothetical protein